MAKTTDEQFVENLYKCKTDQQGVNEKDWAAGGRKPTSNAEFLVDSAGKAAIETVLFPPALYKIIDEVVVNALDHAIVTAGQTCRVTEIAVDYAADGQIRVFNNGPGIKIARHPAGSAKVGRDILAPTFIFGVLGQGSNHEPAPDSITGGVNGLGSKVANCFSSKFTVTTSDGRNYFTQTWTNRMGVAGDPVVVPINHTSVPAAHRQEHVSVTFTPDMALFSLPPLTAEMHALIDKILRARVWFAAAYLCFGVKHKIKVTYNGAIPPVKSLRDIAERLFPGAAIHTCTLNPNKKLAPAAYRYPWEVTTIITDSSDLERNCSGMVNGIIVQQGRHYTYLTKQLNAAVVDYVRGQISDKDAKISTKHISDNMFVFVNAQIPLPTWTGQRKDNLDTDQKNFAGYKFDGGFVAKIGDSLYDILLSKLAMAKMREAKTAGKYSKYHHAKCAGGAKSAQCRLIITEGDSAATQVHTAVSNVLDPNLYGVISTGGVIMNAKDEYVKVPTPAGEQRLPKKRLINNAFFAGIVSALGLKMGCNYDGPNAAKELKTLKYGGIIVCVDQDHDGKGNILGLLLTLFHTLWPGLLKCGYIEWFSTPIVRLYPKTKGKVLSFYTMRDFENFGQTEGYEEPRYYKGIGTHSREETLEMFRTMRSHLYKFHLDERADGVFDIYYGDDAKLRKIELAKPTRTQTDAELDERDRTMTVKCSDHLETDTNMYQKDNLERKLDHIIDGQNQAGRKVLDGIIKYFQTNNTMVVVAQLAGRIAEKENYHHGVIGLGDVITGKGFIGTGGRQLPLIVPESNFGSRTGGGVGDAANARYIKASSNLRLTRLLFPADDYPNLEFNYDDGIRYEPRYFVPIIPMAMIESCELPAHGWKMAVWGRDVFGVIDAVRKMIAGCPAVPPIAINRYSGTAYEWTGKFVNIDGDINSVGRYSRHGDTITITELPLREWTDNYMAWLTKKLDADDKTVGTIQNDSSDYKIHIEVTFRPGVIDTLPGYKHYTDGVIEYLGLRSKMHSHLNFYGITGEVVELRTYEEILYKWFPVRREFYAKRLERLKILAEIKLLVAENRHKYVTAAPIVDRKMKRAEMEAVLKAAGYTAVNSGKLRRPGGLTTDKLRAVILDGAAADADPEDDAANGGATYNYLLSIADYEKSVEGIAEFGAKVDECRAELAKIVAQMAEKPFAGASLWTSELRDLEEVVKFGVKTGWKYEKAGKYTF